MTIIDQSILSALKKGNHPAFEKVFIFYYTKVRTFILGYVKTMADAEELAEDVFVGLWQNHKSIDPGKSFDSYLYTIAKNKALNFLKRKYATKTIIEVQAPSTFSHSPEEEYIALEKALLIEMIVEKMPVQRKKVYLLRQQGLTNEEIARELETTKRNVESQVSLALKEVRTAFRDYLIVFV
ncbi:RNA polymerase sigma-70 factor, ECF subfamily [Tangfeifania diversioriginum]|uniref:RNA polymerase sigma-70 factor, ECF subfamily n=1 Tax=Tangfeifania diversioriginum TaxID=1168035 RepID=A0A1M6J206_9BACT|nr:RNA polymerase sigma-70 factor [Tangfeifania diversioriginum]SHJ40754.1 RNA polymerase sigma-70 factor, ECF subfamily [Tangfeifania diversioriginum]